jgi:uncharacterized SAM-binding protein YcdF (DUF218 family)
MTLRRLRVVRPPRVSQHGGIISSLVYILFLIVFCAVLYFARHPILRFAAESWIVDDTLRPADAIIVISDDNFYADRATRAAEAYRQGLAPVVVASGRRLRPYAGLAELMQHDLIERGVPKDKILLLAHDADNTRDEARALAPLVVKQKWQNVIVVTSNYHTRRTRYIFMRVFPTSTAVMVTAARDGDFDPERWWEKRVSIKRFTHELAGMVAAMWELNRKDRFTSAIPSVVASPAALTLHFV